MIVYIFLVALSIATSGLFTYFFKLYEKWYLLMLMILAIVAFYIVYFALYMISLSTGLDAPSNAGFGMFPIAFAASVNMATLAAVATPLIVSVTALVKGFIARRKK